MAGSLQPVPAAWIIAGRTPWEAWLERIALAPFHDDVEAGYVDSAERIRHPNYQMDLRLAAQNKGSSFT
jgi:hypothetical protein